MSSSYLLDRRRRDPGFLAANFTSQPPGTLPLGGWEDSYIINGAVGECRSGFQAVPMGRPDGMTICRRDCTRTPTNRTRDDGGGGRQVAGKPIPPADGLARFAADMYNPNRLPIQMKNPTGFYDRTMPDEAWYQSHDYIARPFAYNGTGVFPMHQPNSGAGCPGAMGANGRRLPPRVYRQYGFSFGASPPPVYDVTRLQQPSEVYAGEARYLGTIPPGGIKFGPAQTASTF